MPVLVFGLVAFRLWVKQFAYIQFQQGFEDGGAAINTLTEDWLLFVEFLGQSRILLAYSREQEGHRTVTALLHMAHQRIIFVGLQ